MIKVAKDMLSLYFKNPEYFYNGENLKITEANQLLDLKILNKLFMIR